MKIAALPGSLRGRLFAFMLALAGVTALAVGCATYVSVRAEADELFDYHLRQMALSLRDQGRIGDEERDALAMAEAMAAETIQAVRSEIFGFSKDTNIYQPARAIAVPAFLSREAA